MRTYVVLERLGHACFKVDHVNGRSVSVAFTNPDSMVGSPISRPAYTSAVKLYAGPHDLDGKDYDGNHPDTATAMLHALADLLGYSLTKNHA